MPPKKNRVAPEKPKRKRTTKQKTDINFNQILVSPDLKSGPKLYRKDILTEDSNPATAIDVDHLQETSQRDDILYYQTVFRKIFEIAKRKKEMTDWMYK